MKQLHFLPGTQGPVTSFDPLPFRAFQNIVYVCTRTRSPLEVSYKVTFSVKHAEIHFEVDISIFCMSVPILTLFSYLFPIANRHVFLLRFSFSYRLDVELRENISSW